MNKNDTRPKLIVILGCTASGKTEWGIRLAKKFDGEVISADSRQLYRGMDIGTAKPPRDKNSNYQLPITSYYSRGIRHHLIDARWPDEPMSVAEYQKAAIKAIRDALKREKIPFLVGGTGLYIQAVTENLKIPPIAPNPKLREGLERILKKDGIKPLWEKLVSLDPEAAYIVDSKNPRRVIRALEVTMLSAKPFSQTRQKGRPLFKTLKIAIAMPKTELWQRIEKRAKAMTQNKLIDEVSSLIKIYPINLEVFDAIGYREVIAFLKGTISLEECAKIMNQNTKNFARRQMTWFKKDKEIRWVRAPAEAARLIRDFLHQSPTGARI